MARLHTPSFPTLALDDDLAQAVRIDVADEHADAVAVQEELRAAEVRAMPH